MNNNFVETIVKAGQFLGKTGLELMKIGTWGALNQWTNQQFRDSSQHLIGEVERGVGHQARKLKIIKND
jgi:hypothetical protein